MYACCSLLPPFIDLLARTTLQLCLASISQYPLSGSHDMAKAKALALLLCFIFPLALASAQVVDNGVSGDELNKDDDIDSHKGNNDGKGNLKPSQCASECERRCSKTHHKKPCLFFCNKCCAKCLCVPPGTYGNKDTCPCYNNWKTKRGGPKCP